MQPNKIALVGFVGLLTLCAAACSGGDDLDTSASNNDLRGRHRRSVGADAGSAAADAGSSAVDSGTPANAPDGSTGSAPGASMHGVLGTQHGWSWGSDLGTLESMLAEAKAAGATIWRVDFAWTDVQASSASSYNWSWFDSALPLIKKYGLDPLLEIDTTPGWARSSSQYWAPPNDPAAYGTFAAAVAARYVPQGVHLFELWNEPNNGPFWGGQQVDPAKYAAMACAGYHGIKSATSASTTVLAGATAPYGKYTDKKSDDGLNMNPVYFLEQAYAAGIGGCFDALSHHPYSFGKNFTADDSLAVNDWSAWSQMEDYSGNGVPSLRTLMAANGDSAKQIWATEFGAPTGSCSNCISEASQADLVTKAVTKWRSYAWSGALLWYNAHDNGTDASNMEDNFGLNHFDGSHKPSFANFQAQANSP